ncbi:MAG TPA: FGGY family carbohydrate kinase, partial [Spirochaetia bacterium]|nr:FGGY family carbohydrate kinase [Spirochaetia bacterium]
MKSKGYVLCLDFGTSSIKGGLIDSDGRLSAWEREGLLSDPESNLQSWAPAVWTRAFKRIVTRMRRSSLFAAGSLRAVVISGNGPTIVPVDRRGMAMGEALLWIDKRALPAAGGKSFFLPKIRWIQENNPKLYEETGSFLSFPEYLNLYLTGEAATISPSDEFKEFIWTSEEIASIGLDSHKFPPFIGIGDQIGRVGRGAGTEIGLPEGLPVV